jgi:imidazolonepropionase-like amidohydrolase
MSKPATPEPASSAPAATAVDLDAACVDPGSCLVLLGTVIDGTGAGALPDAALIILGERIIAVGPRNGRPIPAQAQVIELGGATILPGFINTHVHNAYKEYNLRLWAQEGVTTVRDLGERLGVPYFSTRDRLRADPQNAWLIAAGPLVTVPKGYPIAGNNFPSLTVTSAEDAREKIGRLIDDGADLIKITLTSGGPPSLSAAEATAIVETAHERGVPVSAHATSARDVQRALDAGVDDVAHLATDRVSDALIQQMVRMGVYWVPTLEALRGGGAENLLRFVTAGGGVALGNDGGYLSGLEIGMPMSEISAMRKAGMTPMQIIVAATRDAARVCRQEATLGTLEAGKLADVLVVDGDPLQDLESLARVRMVIHHGVIIRDEREVD